MLHSQGIQLRIKKQFNEKKNTHCLRLFPSENVKKCVCVKYFNYRDIFIIMTLNKAETLRLVFLFLFSHFVPISNFFFITLSLQRIKKTYPDKNQHTCTCSSSSGVWLCLTVRILKHIQWWRCIYNIKHLAELIVIDTMAI